MSDFKDFCRIVCSKIFNEDVEVNNATKNTVHSDDIYYVRTKSSSYFCKFVRENESDNILDLSINTNLTKYVPEVIKVVSGPYDMCLIIQKYIKSDLSEFLDKVRKKSSEKDYIEAIKFCLLSIIEILESLHELGFEHNNIFFDNFLIDEDDKRIYVTDLSCLTRSRSLFDDHLLLYRLAKKSLKKYINAPLPRPDNTAFSVKLKATIESIKT